MDQTEKTFKPASKQDLVDLLTGRGVYSKMGVGRRKNIWNRWRSLFKRKDFDVSSTDLILKDLVGFDLSYGNFKDCNLMQAALNGADLTGAVLKEANLNLTNFKNAKLIGADLRNAHIVYTQFNKANLSGANLKKVGMAEANFEHANFSKAILDGAKFQECGLLEANFKQASMKEVSFIGIRSLEFCRWNGADLEGANFERIDDEEHITRLIKNANWEKVIINGEVCKKVNPVKERGSLSLSPFPARDEGGLSLTEVKRAPEEEKSFLAKILSWFK